MILTLCHWLEYLSSWSDEAALGFARNGSAAAWGLIDGTVIVSVIYALLKEASKKLFREGVYQMDQAARCNFW